MKDGNRKTEPIVNQRTWRMIGAAAILVCVIMAWYGGDNLSRNHSPMFLLVYWGIFLLFLLAAFYVVLLDIRYIRLMYVLGERDIFENTLGSEEFQKALREAQEDERRKQNGM